MKRVGVNSPETSNNTDLPSMPVWDHDAPRLRPKYVLPGTRSWVPTPNRRSLLNI